MKKILIFLVFVAFLFNGCQEIKESSAQVIDSRYVEGLEYQCAGLIEYTDTNGTLYCNHFPVAFKIGEIKLGIIYKMPDDGFILPQDIVKVPRDNLTNKDVIKVTTILQSLDSDKNPKNGIIITKETRDKLSDIMIDIKKESLEDIKELIKAQIEDINFSDVNNSVVDLNRTMKRFNIR